MLLKGGQMKKNVLITYGKNRTVNSATVRV